ncbi:copper-binding protein [Bradyrhizobium sp. LHD-71]|uniref:copper-binding protein n=1 Tax=Bradyrhizobium sp. LHD-71 TaxID=3072141 RepID=UPI00280E5593|nr:copper-binding protein [Bradyrhizobium sp. LHD-71]MDQ8732613.1 copper-binding protein [Bradyrhizobium sp. LHD-71]
MTARLKLLAVSTAITLGVSSVAFGQAATVDGSVEKIDQAGGKLTLKHGPIKNLDMDAMTMVFRVQDPAMLKKVKVGQKVRFEAGRVNGQITVTRIDPVK